MKENNLESLLKVSVKNDIKYNDEEKQKYVNDLSSDTGIVFGSCPGNDGCVDYDTCVETCQINVPLVCTMYELCADFVCADVTCPMNTLICNTDTPSEYTITCNPNGGKFKDGTTSNKNITTTNQKLGINMPYVSRDNYILRGWYTSTSGGNAVNANTTFASNMTIYALWDQNSTGVIMYGIWTQGVVPKKIYKGSTNIKEVWLGNQRIWPKYSFVGGNSSDNPSTVTYKITFKVNGGSGSMAAQEFNVGEQKQISQNTFTRSGYVFVGWATSSTSDPIYSDQQIISLTSNITLYAIWGCTITWDDNGADTAHQGGSSVVIYGKTITLPTVDPSKNRYSFFGWHTMPFGNNGLYINESSVITTSMTLYARWTSRKYIGFEIVDNVYMGYDYIVIGVKTPSNNYITLAQFSYINNIFNGYGNQVTAGGSYYEIDITDYANNLGSSGNQFWISSNMICRVGYATTQSKYKFKLFRCIGDSTRVYLTSGYTKTSYDVYNTLNNGMEPIKISLDSVDGIGYNGYVTDATMGEYKTIFNGNSRYITYAVNSTYVAYNTAETLNPQRGIFKQINDGGSYYFNMYLFLCCTR